MAKSVELQKTKAFGDDDALHIVMQKVVSSVMGISAATINKRPDLFPKVPGQRGRHDLHACVQNYIAELRGEASTGTGAGKATGERAKLYEQQRRKLELENQRFAGESMEVGAVYELINAASAPLRAGILALSGRLATQAAGMSSASEVRALIDGETTELLRDFQRFFTENFPGIDEANARGEGNGADNAPEAGPNGGKVGGRTSKARGRKRRTGTVAK